MGITRQWFTEHDSTLTNAAHNYGPITVSPGKLTRITVKGAISWAYQTQVATNSLQNNIQHGIQQVPSGNTPAILETGPYNWPQWLYAEAIIPTPTQVFWAPNTATVALEDRYLVNIRLALQFRNLANVDVYYCIGRYNNPGLGFGWYGAMEVLSDA